MTALESLLADIEAKAGAATQMRWVADEAVAFLDGKAMPPTRAVYAYPSESHCVEIIESPDVHLGECIHNPADLPHIARLDPPTAQALVRIVRELREALNRCDESVTEFDKREGYQHSDVYHDVTTATAHALANVKRIAEELE